MLLYAEAKHPQMNQIGPGDNLRGDTAGQFGLLALKPEKKKNT